MKLIYLFQASLRVIGISVLRLIQLSSLQRRNMLSCFEYEGHYSDSVQLVQS